MSLPTSDAFIIDLDCIYSLFLAFWAIKYFGL